MTKCSTRRIVKFAAFVFLLLRFVHAAPLPAQQESADQLIREFRGATMGTTYMVKVAGASAIDDDTLRFAIDAELRRVNDQMSTYLKSSEISKFNQSTSTEWFDVSAEFADVVAAAQSISEQTDGAFDITVAPLVNVWSFGTTERSQTVPDDAVLRSIMQTIGYQKLQVRNNPPALRKSIGELTIDLSSIAKGHGVDRVVSRLAVLGAKDVFVEIGGEVRTAGEKPSGAWKVGIQLPDAASDTVMIAHTMTAGDEAGNAMATSGDYRNVFVVDGNRYSHTIDPRTGKPVQHALASVTIVAATCALADGWATALNVLGPDAGLQVAERNQLHSLLVTRTSQQSFQMAGTGVLAQYVESEKVQPAPPAKESGNWLTALAPVALLSFCVFSILIFAMAIGVVFGRRAISGSCGGLANKTNADGSSSCSLCSNPSDACKELREKMTQKDSAS